MRGGGEKVGVWRSVGAGEKRWGCWGNWGEDKGRRWEGVEVWGVEKRGGR